MPRESLDIRNPLAGASKEMAFQHGDGPYTAPEILNCWPRDLLSRRRRCGSRPGLKRAFAQQLSGTSFDLIAEVREASTSQGTVLTDFADSSAHDPPWNPQTWGYPSGATGTLPAALSSGGGMLFRDHTEQSSGDYAHNMTHTALSPDIDLTASYKFDLDLLETFPPSSTGSFLGAGFWIRMNDTAPLGTFSGVHCYWILYQSGGRADVWLQVDVYSGGALLSQAVDGATCAAQDHQNVTRSWHLELTIGDGGADNVRFTASSPPGAGVPISLAITKTLVTAPATSQRFGFDMFRRRSSSETSGTLKVGPMSLAYTGDGTPASGVRNRIVAIANLDDAPTKQGLFEEDNASRLIDVSTNIVAGITAVTVGRLYQAVDLRGILYIVNYSGDANARLLHYTPLSNALDQATGSPTACELITTYRDALLLAGKRGEGGEWHLSKRGASHADLIGSTAWTADTSVTSYVLGSTSEAGRIGEPITALMRHSDDYMLFGCHSSIWILRGDPNIGGTIDVLDPRHGVITASAHCRGPGSSSFFLALDGLYAIPYGGQQEPIPLSKKLPQELRYINLGQNRVFLAYDVVHEGIIIAVTRIDGGQGTYFFYDMDTQGFFPMRFPTHCEPTFLHYYSADAPGQRAILFGGRDGYIRQFDDFGRSQSDDGVDWTSRMVLGPILLAPSGYADGMLREVIPQTAVGSGDVTMFVQVGNNAETAREAVERNGFTARAGLQLTWTPQLRGNACYIGFEKTGGTSWAMEKTTIVREPLGKLRP